MPAWNHAHTVIALALAIYAALSLGGYRGRQWANSYARYLLLSAAALLILSPFAWLIAAVFKDKDVLMQYSFLPPLSEWSSTTLNLSNFRDLFAGDASMAGVVYFYEYVLNSIFISCMVTMVSLFFSSMGGYALAKFDFHGRRVLMLFMVGSMMFPSMLFLAPLYKLIYQLGWIDSYWSLIAPSAISVFGMFLFRQSFIGVPDSLLESARMDGAGEFYIYLHIGMPLVRPMTGAFCLIVFLQSWNNFISPQIYIQSQHKLTLPVVLNQYIGVYTQQYGVFLAGTLLALIPPAILFLALQREFVAGLTSGAVKG